MPTVRFSADFDWKPVSNVTQAFKAGDEKLVTTPCAEAAVAKGRGEIIKKTRRARADG